MAPLVGAALIGGIASLFGAKSAAERERENMQLQHEYDIDMLNRNVDAQKSLFDYQFDANNAYNDPSAQMARLKAAGLNPNLVYGSLGASSSSASMPGSVESNHVQSFSQDKIANAYASAANQYLTAKQLEIQEKQTINDTKRADAEVANSNARTLGELLQYRRELDKDTPEWNQTNAAINKMIAETNNLNQQTKTEQANTRTAELGTQIAELQVQNTKLLGDKTAAEISQIQQMIIESKSRTTLNYSAAALNRALAKESFEKQALIREQTAEIIIRNDYADRMNANQLDVLRETARKLGSEASKLSWDAWQSKFNYELDSSGFFRGDMWSNLTSKLAYNLYSVFGGSISK